MRVQRAEEQLRLNREMSMKRQWLLYTILFLLTSIGVYGIFFIYHKTLLRNGAGNIDGMAQYYTSYSKIKHVLESTGSEAWSWDVGLGASYLDTFKGKLMNPLTYLITFFPQKYLDIAYSVNTVLRQYLAGVTFLFFGREVKLRSDQNVFGAFCYAYSAWAFRASITQGSFTNAILFYPILVMGVDRILKKKSPFVFILGEVLFLMTNVLWSYIAGVTIIIYFIIRYPHYYDKNSLEYVDATGNEQSAIRRFLGEFIPFIGYGLIGGLIMAISLLSMYWTVTGGITDTNSETTPLLYSWITYILMPNSLFGNSEIHVNFSHVFCTALVAMMIPLIVANLRRKNTASIMAVIFFIAGLFPVVQNIMNGGSYASGRWYFVVDFFLVWAAMEAMEHEIFAKKKSFVILAIWWFALCAWILGFSIFVMRMVPANRAWQSIYGLFAGFIIFPALYVREMKGKAEDNPKPQLRKRMNVLIGAVLIVEVIACSQVVFTESMMAKFTDTGWIEEAYARSTQRVVPGIQEEDTDFYRTDQVQGTTDSRIMRVPVNENVYFGNRSIYEFWSTISSDWLLFNKTMGNSVGYGLRTNSFSNDNRPGLDYLMGVKYFLGDNEAYDESASNYRAYGYDFYKNIDGVEVYKNRYCMGLGTVYPGYITESELMTFSEYEREQVMLQVAVVPDEEAEKVEGLNHISLDQIETTLPEVEVELADSYNIMEMDGADGGEMTVYNFGADIDSGFKLRLPEVKDAMIVVSFQNFQRDPETYTENLELRGKEVDYSDFKYSLYDQDYEDDRTFRIVVNDKENDKKKAVYNYRGFKRGFGDAENLNVTMGYYDSFEGDWDVTISSSGHYTYDAIKVYAIPMDLYTENMAKLDKSKFNVTSFDDEKVVGTVDAEDDGLLYFSVLEDPGWSVYVDGEKAEKIDNVNIAFTGVSVTKGHHDVELRYSYPGMKYAIVLTVVGIVLLIVVMVRYRRRQKTN